MHQGQGEKPRVAVLEWLDPLMGAGNWTPELVAMAGGENVFGAMGQHAPWLTWEELLAADPDVLVLAPCGFTLARTTTGHSAPATASLLAIPASRKKWPRIRH